MKKSYILLLLATLFAFVMCDNNTPQKNPPPQYPQIEGVTRDLLGTWKVDSIFEYDSDWQEVIEIVMLEGFYQYYDGFISGKFTFNADGKGFESSKSISLEMQGIKEFIQEFYWQYEAETQILRLNNYDYKAERKVKEVSNEYLTWDYYDSTNDKYFRQIYKRIVE